VRQLAAAAVFSLVLAGAVVQVGPAAAADAFEAQMYSPPKPAPGFSLPGLDGRVTGLSDLRGRVALLFFWATW
jgi:cytochrome oxidase Cu insertion factor (SCO1/SenC/PrrC family)